MAQEIRTKRYHSNKAIFSTQTLDKYRLFNKPSEKTDFVKTCQCPKVLCCDDDIFQILVLQKILSIGNYIKSIGSFTTGEDLIKAYEIIKKQGCCEPTIIITDFEMGLGKLNGIEVISILSDIHYKGKIFLRSSQNLQNIIESCQSSNKTDGFEYLSKELNLEIQKEKIFDALNQI